MVGPFGGTTAAQASQRGAAASAAARRSDLAHRQFRRRHGRGRRVRGAGHAGAHQSLDPALGDRDPARPQRRGRSIPRHSRGLRPLRRETWSADRRHPHASGAAAGRSAANGASAWPARGRMGQPVRDAASSKARFRPSGTASGQGISRTRIWLRDAQPRALDFASLASMSDMFYPRIWLRRARHVPAGTVSITTYFHADQAELAAAPAAVTCSARRYRAALSQRLLRPGRATVERSRRTARHLQPDRLLQGMTPCKRPH